MSDVHLLIVGWAIACLVSFVLEGATRIRWFWWIAAGILAFVWWPGTLIILLMALVAFVSELA